MMLVVAPTVSDEGLPAVVERVPGYISTQGGTVASTNPENPWGRRRLAYQIQEHRDAFYVLYLFTADPNAILEIERELKLDEQVIRHLVVRYDELTEHEERAPRVPAGEGGFRRSPASAGMGTGGSAPPPTSAQRAEPTTPEADAVQATRTGDTDASAEDTDPGSATESDESES